MLDSLVLTGEESSGRSVFAMGDKSPKREVKSPKKDIKEKRRDKLQKKAAKGPGSIGSD